MSAIHSDCQDEQRLITGREGEENTNICSHTETVIYNPFTFSIAGACVHTSTHTNAQTNEVYDHTNNARIVRKNARLREEKWLQSDCRCDLTDGSKQLHHPSV